MLQKRRFKLHSDENEEEDLSDLSDISCPEPPELQPIKSKKKKKKRYQFTYSEDNKMLKYIMNENRYDEIKGIALWKDMEILQITSHSKQSMKYRFLNTVIPNLHHYNAPKNWIDKLKWLFPQELKKSFKKEITKINFPVCSMLEKWKRPTHHLKSSANPAENGAKKPSKESNVSEEEQEEEEQEEQEEEEQEEEQEQEEQEQEEEQEKEEKAEEEIEEEKRNFNSSNSQSTFPYTESPVTSQHRSKRRKYIQSLQFDSSSESEKEEKEKNVPTASGTASVLSADPSPSKSVKDASNGGSSEEQSELSDYDQYLMEIAKKKSRKKSSRLNFKSSESDQANTTHVGSTPDSKDEIQSDDSVSVSDDRRSRLQYRRHLKKIKKSFGDQSRSTSPKKHKQLNLAEFVINSHPEEILSESRDIDSQETSSDELDKYETIISDIAKLYKLTNREVLSTIFAFNGNIDKTIEYIKLGPELSQLQPWNKEDDDNISSTDESSIKAIAKKRGNKVIAERLQFLENFSEDFMS